MQYLGISSILLLSLTLGQMPQVPTKGTGNEKPILDPVPRRTVLRTTPAAAPSPSLRYSLLPLYRDRTPGNAAVNYLRAAVLRPSGPRDPLEAQAQAKKTTRWEELPLNELPVAEVKGFLKAYRGMFKEVDTAVHMDHCDWQQAGRLKTEDIESILPSVQANREIMWAMAFRCRVELAENRIDEALQTLQTCFQMAKHVGEGPTMIQMLVGIALMNVTINRMEEMIGQPGSPNLYWALTVLPRPLIDPRPAIDGESDFITSFIPHLSELEKGPVSDDRAMKILEQAFQNLAGVNNSEAAAKEFADTMGALGRAAYVAFQGAAAKKELLARNWPRKDVDAMPAAQAIILRSVMLHRELWDEQVKQFFVPYPSGVEGFVRVQQKLQDRRKTHTDDTFFVVLSLAYPALRKVWESHARLERRLTLLRAVEAVRLHAALHNGVPPAELSDITSVIVPEDTLTGKPFIYHVKGTEFTVTAPPSAGEQPSSINSYEFKVTLMTK